MSDFDAWIDTAAQMMGLRITPEQRPGVVQFLALAERMAQTLEHGPFETTDLAPVFTPGGQP